MSNINKEKKLSFEIFEDLRVGKTNIDNYINYIDSVLLVKYYENKKSVLNDDVLNLISLIIYGNNELESMFKNKLKNKIESTPIIEYLNSLEIVDYQKLNYLIELNKSNEINTCLRNLYSLGYLISYNECVKLLSRHFNNKIRLNKTSLKVVLQGLCYSRLDELNIGNHICYFCSKDSISSELLGEYNDEVCSLLLSDKYLEKLEFFDKDNFNEEMIGNIETVFHECEHANQMIGNKSISLENMIILKDLLLKWYSGMDYYNNNYKSISFEVLARKNASINTYRFLCEVDSSLADMYFDCVKKNIDSENDKLNDVINEKYAFNDENKLINIDKNISDILKRKPELFSEYPILEVEFNKDGSNKTLSEMVNYLNENKSKISDREYYEYIFSLFNRIDKYNYKEVLNGINEIGEIESNDLMLRKQICYSLIDLIRHFDYDINKLQYISSLNNETELEKYYYNTSIADINKIISNIGYLKDKLIFLKNKFNNDNSFWSNKLKNVINIRLELINKINFDDKNEIKR